MNHDLAAPRWVAADEVPSWRGSEILRLFMGGTADRDVVAVPAPLRYDVDQPHEYEAVVTRYAWA